MEYMDNVLGSESSDPPDDTDEDRDFQPQNHASESSLSTEEEDDGGRLKRKRTRKLVRCVEKWKKKRAKILRDSGKEYVGSKSIIKPAKSVKEYNHNCRYECKNISEEERHAVFKEFWDLKSWDLQTSFINGCLQTNTPKRSRNNAIKHKKVSICVNMCGKRVCKSFFIKTLDITVKRYDNVVKRRLITNTGVSPKDQRGKHTPSNKTDEVVLQKAIDHINSFPKYSSHYSRAKNPSKKYLSSDLNVQQMYDLYAEKIKKEGETPVKVT